MYSNKLGGDVKCFVTDCVCSSEPKPRFDAPSTSAYADIRVAETEFQLQEHHTLPKGLLTKRKGGNI